MANNKRKGRTRIKLDAKKIALAKQLILREATTTVIANELNISRTFAWRLRKSLVNGVSLHERVIDPPEDEEDDNDNNDAQMPGEIEGVDGVAVEPLNNEKSENQFNHQPFTEHVIKRERATTEDEEEEDNQQESEEDEYQRQQQQQNLEQQQQLLRQIHNNNNNSVATSVIQRTNELKLNNAQQQQLQTNTSNNNNNAILEQQQQKLHNKISVVQQQRLMENINNNDNNAHHEINNDSATDTDSDNDADDDEHLHQQYQRLQQQQQQTHEQQETDHNNSQQQTLYLQKSSNNLNDTESSAISLGKKLPLIDQLAPAVAAAINQLPVNLSIRPIASMQNNEISSNNYGSCKKKPRKPNVFIDDEKYAMAKMLVAQNASTMEIAKALNVSQMTAWKLRDAIIKGVPLSYRNRRDIRMTMMRHDEDAGSVLSEGSDTRRETETERQQQALLVQQQLDHQQKLQQQHLQQQQQIQQLLQRQQQLQQQQQQLEQQKQQRQQEKEREQQQQLLLEQQKQLLQKQQLQQQQQQQQSTTQIQPTSEQQQKHSNPRRRLKAAEREVRDKEITREILELIKEDNNIQYWKVSARLAEKGYAISPSSVCQKLKSMGIHRRWKPGDKPPLIDMEQLKGNHIQANSGMLALATAAANAQNAASSSADESYEQQFDMGGAHFLSAFTR